MRLLYLELLSFLRDKKECYYIISGLSILYRYYLNKHKFSFYELDSSIILKFITNHQVILTIQYITSCLLSNSSLIIKEYLLLSI